MRSKNKVALALELSILRKIIKGYENSFDFTTFEKMISTKVFLYLIEQPICNSAKCKMKFTGHLLRYSTAPLVTTLFTESSQEYIFVVVAYVLMPTMNRFSHPIIRHRT